MNTQNAAELNPRNLSLETAAAPLHGVLVYEDFATGLRARRLFEQLAARLEPAAETRLSFWRFDLFASLPLRNEAASEATVADLIVLSAHGTAGLPTAVKAWGLEWLEQRPGHPCALVVLLDRGADALMDLQRFLNFLGPLAQQAGVDIFHHSTHAPVKLLEST